MITTRTRWMLLLLVGLMTLGAADRLAAADKKKVLYVTHEPGRWHKYTPQMAIFKQIAAKAG